MGTDNFDILKVQVVERSTEVVQLGPPLNFKFKDVFDFRLILKTSFLVFFVFCCSRQYHGGSCGVIFYFFFLLFSCFYFLLFACYCELIFACSRISHGRNGARREVGGLDRARPRPEDNKDYFAIMKRVRANTRVDKGV